MDSNKEKTPHAAIWGTPRPEKRRRTNLSEKEERGKEVTKVSSAIMGTWRKGQCFFRRIRKRDGSRGGKRGEMPALKERKVLDLFRRGCELAKKEKEASILSSIGKGRPPDRAAEKGAEAKKGGARSGLLGAGCQGEEERGPIFSSMTPMRKGAPSTTSMPGEEEN